MLKRKLIPTALINHAEKNPIRINKKLSTTHFRFFYLASQLLKFLLQLLWLKLTKRFEPKQVGILLRNFFHQMGVLWIKAGQLLSLRLDLLSPEICEELTKLQDQAHGFSPAIAKSIIEEELGTPLETHFSTFIDMPFAAASISQVHKAYLKQEQVWVAIKVRKPCAYDLFSSDITLIRGLVRLLQWLAIKPHMRWQDMLWEIEQLMIEELDYHYEVTNMRRMKKVLRRHKIYVPKVFTHYCTKQILVMEFIPGVLMSDYLKVARTEPERLNQWLKTNNVKPSRLGQRLFYTNLRQLFEDNLFHGDLHPGNIILLRNSMIAFIDFGSIGFSDQDFLKKYALYLEAIVTQQYAKVFDIYLLFPDTIPATDLTLLKEEFIQIFQSWHERCQIKELSYNDKSVSALSDELLAVLGKYGISMTWAFLRFIRASTTLDAALRELIPHKDVNRLLVSYFKGHDQRMMEKLARNTEVNWANWPAVLAEAPIRQNEAMIFRGAIIRRLAQVFESVTTKVARLFNALFNITIYLLRLFELFLLLVFSQQYQIDWLVFLTPNHLTEIITEIPQLEIQVWVIIFMVLVYNDHILTKLRRRFREADSKGVGL